MAAGEELKKYSREEVKIHNNVNSCWMIIDNKVYDITKFLDEHPGGCEVLLEQGGKDGTELFEDVGHSTDARDMKENYTIGEVIESDKWKYSSDKSNDTGATKSQESSEKSLVMEYGYPVVFFAVFGILFYWLLRIIF